MVERIEIKSPLNGAVISLKEVSDPVFSGGVLGEGAAVIPSDGKVYAPADGMISAVMDSKHAVGITADNQAEILIHVGLDTVNLKGEGYDVITPVLISNPADFISIKAAETKEIAAGEVLLTIV